MPMKLETLDPSALYDADEAGEILGINAESVRSHFRKGSLPYRKAFGKHVVLGIDLMKALGFSLDRFDDSIIGQANPDKITELMKSYEEMPVDKLIESLAKCREENLRLKAFMSKG